MAENEGSVTLDVARLWRDVCDKGTITKQNDFTIQVMWSEFNPLQQRRLEVMVRRVTVEIIEKLLKKYKTIKSSQQT